MILLNTILSAMLTFFVSGASEAANQTRTEKLFNLFQIVSFPNSACSTSSGDTGSCLASTECQGRGGAIMGSCAQGFGACCVITLEGCGGSVTHNCSYIRNPGYPSEYTTSDTCSWTFPKTSSDICMIRLDFDTFSMRAPSGTGTCPDYFQATGAATGTTQGSSGKLSPKICGENAGSHIYIDAGERLASEASLSAVLTQSASWKIKVIQIPCGSQSLPPGGCLQHHTGIGGQVRSFNFLASSYKHLSDQYYKVCIRREKGYCKIGWTKSADTDSFKISRNDASYNANTGPSCANDAIKIPMGSNSGVMGPSTCSSPNTASAPTMDRYCGGALNCDGANPAKTQSHTIISEKLPFELEVFFNSQDQDTTNNRGFCLNYYQIPC